MPMFTLKAAAAQLSKLIARAEAGEEYRHRARGQILAALSHDRVGGERHDREWPGRALQTMW